ncbi:hypothetical protein AMTRI_Chr13g84170 [Amborella trichopoda]|uniref:ARID domain-containing protein n=2 Tax=Magnoliopsida TaxID=3398 RepID=W1NJV4_AMBTC|nr:AT-rich interactive domain-containing protein 4 [Amborella trichopoda]XP_020532199.1 AT-rich interactive domain-containing protein 4 [Amborella trichopoda]ERM96067.1 hypothetical protein AMTR_s00129p00111730 [Amborella trichopoda]|eukprot:XP_006828651.1 AT-rich interactive domain-containing protein 4 [Amborella trichopoda]
MLQGQGTYSVPKQSCILLGVLCGKRSDKEKQENAEDRPVYPFPELVSSGRLEVQIITNPSSEEFKRVLESSDFDFVYLQGEQSLHKDEVGPLVLGDVNISSADAITRLFGSKLPSTVYLEIPNGEKLAEALHSKGVPYVIYWRHSFSCYAACHFRQALVSTLQSSSCHTWDVFQLAQASFRLYCVRNNHNLVLNGQKVSGKLGPRLLGEAPKILTPILQDTGESEGSPSTLSAIKIYDDEVSLRFLVCGEPCTLDACLLGSLEDGLNALLSIEIRGSKLHNRVSALPPPLAAGTFSRGVITMRCDLSTCSSARLSLLVSGSAQTCFDEQLLECHIKNELIEKSPLVRALPSCEESKPSLSVPRKSACVACGAAVFEVWMKVPSWAAQVLCQLAPEIPYRSLVTLGIASIQGTPVASFEKADADRLLFFCTKQGKSSDILLQLFRNSLSTPANWLRPTPPRKIRLNLWSGSSNTTNTSNQVQGDRKRIKLKDEKNTPPRSPIEQKVLQNVNEEEPKLKIEENGSILPTRKRMVLRALRPIPHSRRHKLLPFTGVPELDPHDGSPLKASGPVVASVKHNYGASAPVSHRKNLTSSFQAQQIVSLNPLPLKKHGCSRGPIQECSEEEFLRDVMQFLILRGHTRLVPAGGLAEFPDAILNAKRLDLYNLYREVVSRGGFNVGNGINWKGQVFSKMRNHTTTNRMTGVGNTLKRHYETYLLEYELAHDDVDGECCLLCHSSAAGDWVNCGICGEWAHFGCDRRLGLGAFKDYAKTDGLEYICPRCSASNFRGASARKTQKMGNGYSQALTVSHRL